MHSAQMRYTTAELLKPYRSYAALKRALDVSLSLIGAILFVPLAAVIALLIKLESPGPALFVQTRIGKDGRPFRILKFRTMRHKPNISKHEAFMRAFVRGVDYSLEEDIMAEACSFPQCYSPCQNCKAVIKPVEVQLDEQIYHHASAPAAS